MVGNFDSFVSLWLMVPWVASLAFVDERNGFKVKTSILIAAAHFEGDLVDRGWLGECEGSLQYICGCFLFASYR